VKERAFYISKGLEAREDLWTFEDERDTFIYGGRSFLLCDAALYARRMESPTTLLWKPQDLQLSSLSADRAENAAQYGIVGEADLPATWSYLCSPKSARRGRSNGIKMGDQEV
jgi:hypothetical protein